MFSSFKLKIIFLMMCSYQVLLGQENPKVKDSAKVFRNIEKYSKKSKFTYFIHKLIFEPVAKQKIKKNSFHKIKKQHYVNLEDKIIRKINVTTLDPFGYSITDTSAKSKKKLPKMGNSLHIKTHNFAIYNLLLIKENTPLDSLLVKESERLIRSQHFIRGVTISSELIAKNSDSVDVFIRVLDSWSLIPDFSISNTKSSFYLKDKNFLGTGHEFANSYANAFHSSQNAYSSSYTIPNIENTFIKSTFSYKVDLDHHYSKFIDIERPFFSAYARWAAGIYFDQQYARLAILTPEQLLDIPSYKYNSQDFWGGYSHPIFKGNAEYNRVTNFITTARYFNKFYIEKPITGFDSLGVYTNEKLYLMSFGISSRSYTQDKYVFNYDVVEDIASGFAYSITSGYQFKNEQYRFYIGSKVSLGSYFDFGYLSSALEYGTFFNGSKNEQTTYNLSLIYFTNLLETGKWKFRQFIKPQIIIGANRLNTNTDRLTLNSNSGLQGFESKTLYGTQKLVMTIQTQGYSPWQVFGFRMNPFLSYTFGMLGDENSSFKNSKLYSELGVGFIISNDYLVFNSFQVSFSYFPIIPMDINSNFKNNAFRTADFSLQDFEISKPLLVNYQ